LHFIIRYNMLICAFAIYKTGETKYTMVDRSAFVCVFS
jgi:hypothetical protein